MRLGLVLAAAVLAWPLAARGQTAEECILAHMRGIGSDVAANAIIAACRATALGGYQALLREASATSAALTAERAEHAETRARLAAAERRLAELARERGQGEALARVRAAVLERLAAAFAGRPAMRREGERFVIESEALFAAGSAELGPAGLEQVARAAEALRTLGPELPAGVAWVLQVDGHTDRRPVATRFRSNWELSTARAIAVARVLIERGLPPERLAVAGFGEFHPIDPGGDDAALSRNRRIELRLTAR